MNTGHITHRYHIHTTTATAGDTHETCAPLWSKTTFFFVRLYRDFEELILFRPTILKWLEELWDRKSSQNPFLNLDPRHLTSETTLEFFHTVQFQCILRNEKIDRRQDDFWPFWLTIVWRWTHFLHRIPFYQRESRVNSRTIRIVWFFLCCCIIPRGFLSCTRTNTIQAHKTDRPTYTQ